MISKIFPKRFLLALFIPVAVFGFELPNHIQPGNGTLFPKEFFPDISEQSPEKIFLEGMVTLYPGRILDKAPESSNATPIREPLTEALPRGITYMRVYDFESAEEQIKENIEIPALIIDLRYLHGDYVSAVSFLSLLGMPNELQIEGKYNIPKFASSDLSKPERHHPVIILVNHRTRGAIEAALESLQIAGKIMTVGTHTAGATGSYEPVPSIEGFWVITGSVQSSNGSSLLGVGLTPDVPVSVTPEEDFTGYQLIESGSSAESILRSELPTLDPASDDSDNSDDNSNGLKPVDHIMQRAVDIIIALQILGKLPDAEVNTQK